MRLYSKSRVYAWCRAKSGCRSVLLIRRMVISRVRCSISPLTLSRTSHEGNASRRHIPHIDAERQLHIAAFGRVGCG
jgi:hypothetical protein